MKRGHLGIIVPLVAIQIAIMVWFYQRTQLETSQIPLAIIPAIVSGLATALVTSIGMFLTNMASGLRNEPRRYAWSWHVQTYLITSLCTLGLVKVWYTINTDDAGNYYGGFTLPPLVDKLCHLVVYFTVVIIAAMWRDANTQPATEVARG